MDDGGIVGGVGVEEPLYQRQSTLGIVTDQTVAVVGVGGIGSWVALYLALAGVRRLELYDSDEISLHNLNRFPLGMGAVGKNKALAMAEHCQGLRPDIEVIPRMNYNPDLHSPEIFDGCNWVVVTTDSLKSRRVVFEAVRARAGRRGWGLKYIECGAEGHHANVTFAPATFSSPEESQPGYQSVPVFVGPCVMAAGIAAYYVLLGTPVERTYDINWLRESERQPEMLGLAITNEEDTPDGMEAMAGDAPGEADDE